MYQRCVDREGGGRCLQCRHILCISEPKDEFYFEIGMSIIVGRSLHIINKYVINIHTFIYRALLNLITVIVCDKVLVNLLFG